MLRSADAADLERQVAEPAAAEATRIERAVSWPRAHAVFFAILFAATGLRVAHLGRPSLGYDEVVTMTLARQPSVSALLRMLPQIDATRAPLHPLILQAWLRLFGTSDVAGRSLSVVCGIAAIVLVYQLGCLFYDARTARWAAWLAATSPVLVQYSQETRMYAWLVLWACLAWLTLLSFRQSAGLARQVAFLACLLALVYSHPLGVFMVVALAAGYWANRTALQLSPLRWVGLHVVWALGFAAWVPHYLDHPPEIVFERSWRLWIGWLIPFTGGNGKTMLLIFWPLCLLGLLSVSRRVRVQLDGRLAATSLLAWLVIPPALLWLYSLVSHAIFGAPRYLLYVAPAYLLLVAHGLAKLPSPLRFGAAGVAVVLAGNMIGQNALSPAVKIDWRSAAAILEEHAPGAPVAVFSQERQSRALATHPDVVCLRYYLPATADVAAADEVLARQNTLVSERGLWLVYADAKEGEPAAMPAALAAHYEPMLTWQLLRVRLVLCRKR